MKDIPNKFVIVSPEMDFVNQKHMTIAIKDTTNRKANITIINK